MKRSRRYVPVLIAALILLAGCGAGGNGTTTTAPTESTPTPTPEPTLDSIDYPSGLSQAGYENDSRALTTFREALSSGPAYTVRMDVQSGSTTQTLVARTDPDAERISARTERDGSLRYELYYANGTQSIRNAERDPEQYGSTNATFEGAVVGFNGGKFFTSVSLLDLNATEVTREDGRTVIVYNVTGARSSASDVASASGTVRVTTGGQVVAFEYTVVSTQDQRIHVEWTRTKVGSTTVRSPEWLSKAGGE